MSVQQTDLKNEQTRTYSFLVDMYDDDYFPDNLVDKGKDILVGLCHEIETRQPKTLEALYALTHAATDEFNDLQLAFEEQDSEIETVARECIAADFEFIAIAYGFDDADAEELIGTRDW